MHFSKAFTEMDHDLASRLTNITCHEIFKIKDDFYQIVESLCGHTANLTGITELLIYRMIYHTLDMKHPIINKSVYKKDLSLLVGKRYRGKNGKNQEPDLVVEQNEKIHSLFSVKNVITTATPTPHEQESPLVHELTALNGGYNSAIQDLFRIDNIRYGIHHDFKSITIVFSKPTEKHEASLKLLKQKFTWHHFLILQDNHSPFMTELNTALHLNLLRSRLTS